MFAAIQRQYTSKTRPPSSGRNGEIDPEKRHPPYAQLNLPRYGGALALGRRYTPRNRLASGGRCNLRFRAGPLIG